MQNLLHLSASYGRYINLYRGIKNINDGLAIGERRIIFASFLEWGLKYAKNQKNPLKKKTFVIIGDTTKIHPHGDGPIYDTLVSLVHKKFFMEDANFGNNIENESIAASPRYTETRPNTEIFSLFWDYMDPNNTVSPWVKIETDEIEPPFLISPIPLGLIGNNISHAIGGSFNSRIPQYTKTDLFKRLKYLLSNNEKDKIIIKPNITGCTVKELSENAFEDILKKGTGRISIEPNYIIKEAILNKKKINYLLFDGVNPISKLGDKIIKSGKKINSKTINGFNSMYRLENDKYYCDVRIGDIGIDIKKRDVSDRKISILNYDSTIKFDDNFIKKIVELMNGKIKIICNVVSDNDIVTLTSIDNMLLRAYTNWKNYKLYIIDKTVIDKNKELISLKILKAVKSIYNDLINNKIIPSEELILKKCNELKIEYTENEIKEVLNKYTIKKFIDDEQVISVILNELEELNKQIKNIDNICFNEILNFIN